MLFRNNTKKYILTFVSSAFFLLTPIVTFAAGCQTGIRDAESALAWPLCMLSTYLIPILMSAEVVVFLIAVIRFMVNAENKDARQKSRQMMLWAIIALFVSFALFGLVLFIQNSLGIGGGGTIRPPQLPETVFIS